MLKEDIENAIRYLRKYKTETDKIEVKSARNGFPKTCYDTLSSFSNKDGGLIIFGIDEEAGFEICGVYDVNDLQKQIFNLCATCMEPSLRPKMTPYKIGDKTILAVEIEELNHSQKPCYYKNKGLSKGAYTRVGDCDTVMSEYEIYSIKSYNDDIKEDLRLNKSATIEDLNKESLNQYILELKAEKPNLSKSSRQKILKLSGIIDKDNKSIYPTLAGTMVFSDYPQAFYPQLFIACIVVPGTALGDVGELGQRFNDNKRIEGNIEQMLEGALNFIRKNMRNKVIIDSKTGKRKDVYEYPILALREAIANALIHRDYSNQTENAYIQVYMYDDRIEIQNPGTLYGINKIEKLGTDTIMESRNSTLVRILEEKSSVIENRHSGIPTMRREMRKMGLPDPEFFEEKGSFKVVFKNSKFKNNKSSDTQNESSDTQNVSSDTQIVLSDTQIQFNIQELNRMVLEFCVEPRTAKEIREHINITSKRYVAYEIIKPLVEKGLLDFTNKKNINARNQKYITIDKPF